MQQMVVSPVLVVLGPVQLLFGVVLAAVAGCLLARLSKKYLVAREAGVHFEVPIAEV